MDEKNLVTKGVIKFQFSCQYIPQTAYVSVTLTQDGKISVYNLVDRFWAGLFCDLVIEQVLISSLETSGGIIRRHGMSELQWLTWLLFTPASAAVSSALQGLSGITFETSEQSKDGWATIMERVFKIW